MHSPDEMPLNGTDSDRTSSQKRVGDVTEPLDKITHDEEMTKKARICGAGIVDKENLDGELSVETGLQKCEKDESKKNMENSSNNGEEIGLDGIDFSAINVNQLEQSFRSALPFSHCIVDKLFNQSLCDQVQNDLLQQPFAVKENDLFSFLQSADLSTADSEKFPAIKKVVEALYSAKFRHLLSSITGITNLDSQIDLTCSIYGRTHHLLCHDDKLSTRKLAFIYYLVPEMWNEDCGGTLDLFTVDEEQHPNGIYKRIVPRRNSLVIFEVGNVSFHQVAEVLTEDDMRLSIGGWFHSSAVAKTTKTNLLLPKYGLTTTPTDIEAMAPQIRSSGLIKKWVNETYFTDKTQASIREYFEENSCIQLYDFLLKERYDALVSWFNDSPKAAWKRTGPYEKQHVEILECDDSSGSQNESELGYCVRDLFQSREMVDLLEKLTDLSIEKCRTSIRRFDHSCYTLCCDSDSKQSQDMDELDLVFTILDSEKPWDKSGDGEPEGSSTTPGGERVWMVEDEEEPLLMVQPEPNMITLVFRKRDQPVQSFVKYVNNTAPSPLHELTMLANCK